MAWLLLIKSQTQGAVMEDTTPQFIVSGAMYRVSSGALCSALEESGHTVIYAINQFFV